MSGDRCVLWLAQGVGADPELLGALERKGLTVETCTNAFEALARLCLASRQSRSGRAPRASVLLLADPDALAGAGEVVRLAERYAPRSKAWVFEPRTRRLRGATPEDMSRWGGVHVRIGRTFRGEDAMAPVTPTRAAPGGTLRPPAAPRATDGGLRLSGHGPLPPSQEESHQTPDNGGRARESEGRTPPAGLLSDEELAMLLSPDDPSRED